MIYGGTGHRPNVLCETMTYEDGMVLLINYAIEILPSYKPTKIISGMALGWDQAVAQAAVALGIPFIAAVPFVGQEFVWKDQQKTEYTRLLSLASEVKIVSPGGYTTQKYHERDKWMVDNSDSMLALWSGVEKGGTYSTIKYAKKVQKPVFNVWPGWEAKLAV
jgi:uncharacterized phage-like protein YoqJ